MSEAVFFGHFDSQGLTIRYSAFNARSQDADTWLHKGTDLQIYENHRFRRGEQEVCPVLCGLRRAVEP
jgi:hypothetical protein